MKVFLAEKPNLAKKIALAMGWKKDGSCYKGKFEGEDAVLVYAKGHLVCYESPDDISPDLGWDDPAGLENIPRTFRLIPIPDPKGAKAGTRNKDYLNNIKKHLKGCTEFINCCDADREGEAIGWMIAEYLGYEGPARRAWFSRGEDKKSIQDAMANLRPKHETYGYYRAAEARGRSDWPFMYLTRLYTFYARRGHFGPNLGAGSGRAGVASAGRVQTPTLSLIIRREFEIANFKSQDHFDISGIFDLGANISCKYSPEVTAEIIDNQPIGVFWKPSLRMPKNDADVVLDEPLYTGRAEVDAFKARLLGAKDQARVVNYKESQSKQNPPKTFSLSTAQSEVSKQLKISAIMVQDIISDLYHLDYISYPRTSKADLPVALYEPSELNSMLDAISGLPELTSLVNEAKLIHSGQHGSIAKFMPSVFIEGKLEHYGLVPTSKKMTPERLEELAPKDKKAKYTQYEMAETYKIIVKRYLQALFPPAIYSKQDVIISVPVVDMLGNAESVFKTSGRLLVEKGWLDVFNTKPESEKQFASLTNGALVEFLDLSVSAQKTTPPKRYTELNIITGMENIGRTEPDPSLRKLLKDTKGIGTPATRSSIVTGLLERGYIEVKKGAYHPTEQGIDLYNLVAEDWMKTPGTTALWEDYLIKIDAQTDDSKAVQMRDAFVNKQIDNIELIIKKMNEKYRGNIGVLQSRVPEEVTLQMKKMIDFICKKTGVEVDDTVKTDPRSAVQFLEANKAIIQAEREARASRPPSERQLQFINQSWEALADSVKELLGGDDAFRQALSVTSAASVFIDKLKKHVAPSEAMVSFAKKLAEELPEDKKPSDSIYATAEACSAFIDSQTKGSKKSRAGKKGAPRKAGARRRTAARKKS